ncbi:MAG: flagellar filament capping protein FliD [Spirochaetota bacterium]|nr:MAG: flagellar filament capping protein FliD [Spirochaetota bacterium]
MPDINLPGISNNVDVKEIIDGLVKVESKKLDRLEDAKEQLDREKSAWVSLGNKIEALQDASKELYGFRAPFDNKLALSSDETLLTANAARIAHPSKSTIRIEQVARNERIVSDPVQNERIFERIPVLRFRVGEKEAIVHFDGGRVEDLVDAINEQAGDYVTAKVARDTKDTSVIILESRESGEKNRITVSDESSVDFFKQLGIFEEGDVLRVDTAFLEDRFEAPPEAVRHRLEDGTLLLDPEGEVKFSIDEAIEVKDSVHVRIKIRAVDIPKEKAVEPVVVWPELKGIGKVQVRDVEVIGGSSIPHIVEEKAPPVEEPVVFDNHVFGVIDTRGQKKIFEIDDLDQEFKEYTFRSTDLFPEGTKIGNISFTNSNTQRRIEYRELVIEDTAQREGLAPKHLVQEGRDAIMYIDGVKIQRGSNEIDDAVKGVTLRLNGESDDEVVLKIDRDYERITEKIIDMIEKYNELLKFINDGMKVVPSGNIGEENEVGVLTGDITVFGLKNKLQNIMMNPYPTSKGKELALLAQIGISMGAHGTSWSDIKGGYLTVDEDKFIEALRRYPVEVKQLFGSDTNNDVVIDNGVALVMETTLKGYTDPQRGIVSYHIRNKETEMNSQQRRIDDWNEHLEDYRKKLESDFTIMQQALHELEQNQKSLENFSKQFGNK